MTPEQQKNNSVASAAGVCRICYEDSSSEELIEPCECSGSHGLIHVSCLEKWLSTWNTDCCEICKYSFAVESRAKPLHQSFRQWWHTRGLYGPQGVTGDAICLIVLTPLCLAATYLCGVGASAYARLGLWEGTGLAVLCFMLVVTYFLWLFVTIRFHYKSWKQWCRRNQDVKLLAKRKLSDEDREKTIKEGRSHTNDGNSRLKIFCRWFDFSYSHRTDPVFNFHRQTTFV